MEVPKEDLSFEVLQELCGMTLDWRTDPADHSRPGLQSIG